MAKNGRQRYLFVTTTNWQKGGKEGESGYPELRRDGQWTTLEIGKVALILWKDGYRQKALSTYNKVMTRT
jgi:hypothetical protein